MRKDRPSERPPAYPQVELRSFVIVSSVKCRHCQKLVDLSRDALRIPVGGYYKVTHLCGNIFKLIDDGD